MTQEAVLYIRWSWVQIMSVYTEKRLLFQLPSLCKTLGSWPGLVTYGRGDAVPCCPSYMAWPSQLGLFQLRHPFVFTGQCEPDVGAPCSAGGPPAQPSAPATGSWEAAMANQPFLAFCVPLRQSWSSLASLHLPFPQCDRKLERILDKHPKSICPRWSV